MAELRKITIPNEITVLAPVLDEQGNETGRKQQQYTFFDYVSYLVSTQPQFNKDGPAIRTGDRILKKLGEAKESEDQERSITLDEPDWTLLQKTSEKPERYPFGPGRLLLPFMDAINDAEKV